jgi:hypothetical protein
MRRRPADDATVTSSRHLPGPVPVANFEARAKFEPAHGRTRSWRNRRVHRGSGMSRTTAVRAVVIVMRVTILKASGDRVGGLLTYYAGLVEDRERSGPTRGRWTTTWIREEPPVRKCVGGASTRRSRLRNRCRSSGPCHRSTRPGRGPRRPRHRSRGGVGLVRASPGSDPPRPRRRAPGRHPRLGRGRVPSAHVPGDGPAAANPTRGDRREGPRPLGAVAVVGGRVRPTRRRGARFLKFQQRRRRQRRYCATEPS